MLAEVSANSITAPERGRNSELRGAVPRRARNPAQVVTSFGGLMFMVLSALFVGLFILLEAGPVYTLFMADLNRRPLVFLEWLWVGASFFLAGVLCLVAMIVPMCRGARSLADTHS